MRTLNELMQEVFFKDGPVEIIKGVPDYFLPNNVLKDEKVKKLILNTVEFQDVDELVVPETDESWEEHKTMKVEDGLTRFKGRISLVSLQLTPKMYDPETMYRPVKNGIVITPSIYDPNSLKVTRKIVIEYSPEQLQDEVLLNNTADVLEDMKRRLTDAVYNVEDYEPDGVRGVLVRFKQL